MPRSNAAERVLFPIIVIVRENPRKPPSDPDRAQILRRFFAAPPRKRTSIPLRQVADRSFERRKRQRNSREAVGGAPAEDAFHQPRPRQAPLSWWFPSGDSNPTELREAFGAFYPPAWLTADIVLEVGGQAQYYHDFDEA
jgi:hypothetical protein